MIYIKETQPDENKVAIQVEGKLDRKTLPCLREVCRQHFESETRPEIEVHLDELADVSREGKEFLSEIKEKVTFSGLPEFLKLGIYGPETMS